MLREYKREDLEYMRSWVNNPEVVDNLSDIFLAPSTVDATEQFLASVLERRRQNSYCFVIADKETEEYIGQIDLMNIDWKNRCGEIGIVIGAEQHRGKGIGAEALSLLQDFAFNRVNLNRLEIKVHSYNTPALRCYRKSGFVEEGRLRANFYIHGDYFDTIILSMLKSEFIRRKEREDV